MSGFIGGNLPYFYMSIVHFWITLCLLNYFLCEMGTHSNPHKEVLGMWYVYVDKKSFAQLPFPLTCPPSFVRFHSHFIWLLAKVVTEMRLDPFLIVAIMKFFKQFVSNNIRSYFFRHSNLSNSIYVYFLQQYTFHHQTSSIFCYQIKQNCF